MDWAKALQKPYLPLVIKWQPQPEQLQALKEKYGENIFLIQLDVTVKAQIKSAVEQAIQQFGRKS